MTFLSPKSGLLRHGEVPGRDPWPDAGLNPGMPAMTATVAWVGNNL